MMRTVSMKVLLDSSDWGNFFNGHPSTEARALEQLVKNDEEICACVVEVSER